VVLSRRMHDEAVRMVQKAITRRDCEGAYYLLCRALFSAGRFRKYRNGGNIAGRQRRGLNVLCANHELAGAIEKTRFGVTYSKD